MDLDPTDPRLPSRPLIGLAILSLPLFGVLLLLSGYALIFGMGLTAHAPSGPQTALRFAGCPDARASIEARLGDMGLAASLLPDDPADGTPQFGFLVSLPDDPTIAETIPDTLVAPGLLRIMGGEELLADNSDLRNASVRMDLLVEPSLLLELKDDAADRVVAHIRAHPRGALTLWVDGRAVAKQSNERPVLYSELEFSLVPSPESDPRARWAILAAWSVTVDHPLPCLVELRQ